MRINRKNNELRNLKLEVGYSRYAEGSCLISLGNTVVLCTASVDEKVPYFLKHTGGGWLHAEYNMLPRATHTRTTREVSKGGQSGRTHEIQRLIGRALRSGLNLQLLGERQIIIDCDVLQADGGTRVASVTGGYIALYHAVKKLIDIRVLRSNPIISQVVAISAGIVNNTALLDLEYEEDSSASVDANFVMNDKGEFVEIQSTAEKGSFSGTQFSEMFALAAIGMRSLVERQKEALR